MILTSGRTLVLLICWKGLPSGGWSWACWRLRAPHNSVHDVLVNKKADVVLVFVLFFYWRKHYVLPLFLFRRCFSISFHRVQGCSICARPFRVLVPGVSPLLFLSLCSMWSGDAVPSTNLGRCTSSILYTSVLVCSERRGRDDPAPTDPVWYSCLLSSHDDSKAKYNTAEPIPFHVEHFAVEFVLDPFRLFGLSRRTMRTTAQWCHSWHQLFNP